MFLNVKKMAFLGLLLALTVLLVILGGILEFNTLFLLAAASFGIGIAIRETGLGPGCAFFIASILLSFILAPNKLYCITYSAMAFYVLAAEFTWLKLDKASGNMNRKRWLWIFKYAIFNLIYLPILLFMPRLVYQGEISTVLTVACLLAGQVALFVYDFAYRFFQGMVWGKVRSRINFD